MRWYPHVAQVALEVVQVARHDGLDVTVEHGRVAALELTPLLRHLVRERDRQLWRQFGQNGAALQLVLRVDVTVQEADGDGLHARGQQLLCRRLNVRALQRTQHFAPEVQAFARLQAQPARHEGRRLNVGHVVYVGAVGAPDFQHVAEAPGGN